MGVKLGIDAVPELTDIGRFKVTNVEADKGAFKTPSLRNIALTAPYMHDGSDKNLKEAIDFYIGGGNFNDYRDREIHPLDFLTGQERADLQEFLKALTGEIPPNVGPLPAPQTLSLNLLRGPEGLGALGIPDNSGRGLREAPWSAVTAATAFPSVRSHIYLPIDSVLIGDDCALVTFRYLCCPVDEY